MYNNDVGKGVVYAYEAYEVKNKRENLLRNSHRRRKKLLFYFYFVIVKQKFINGGLITTLSLTQI